jgi:hypothetical protein
LEDGTVYVDGWNEWQEGDLTVRDRMAALRNRRRNSTVTGTVTPTVTEPSPPATRYSVGVGVGISGASNDAPPAREGLPNLDQGAIRALEHRTGRPIQIAGDKQLTEYDRLIEDHGLEKVLSAMDRLMTDGQPMTARQLVWGAMKVLEPMVDTKELAKTERQDELDRTNRRAIEATQRHLRELRSVGERKPA